jgi:hypothetical protein
MFLVDLISQCLLCINLRFLCAKLNVHDDRIVRIMSFRNATIVLPYRTLSTVHI